MVVVELEREVFLTTDKESDGVIDLQLAVGEGYPLVEEGVGVRFEDRLRQSLELADKAGKDYAEKNGLNFKRLPRLRQSLFKERDGGLELMKPMVELGFKNIDLRAEEMQVIKAEDVYTVRQVELSEAQREEIEAKHGRKVALSLLLRGRVEGEENRYHDVMFLVYEDEIERKLEVAEAEVEWELDNKLAQRNGFWILGRNDFEVIDESLKEVGVSLRQEDKLSNQMKELYKRANGEYQQKVLLTELGYELFNIDIKNGEMSLALTGFSDYELYETIRDGLVRLMVEAQTSEIGVAFIEGYERVTVGSGGLSGATTNETEDILEKTAVDRDGNVWTAFKEAPPGEMFSDDQIPQEVRNLENQIMSRIRERRQERGEVLSVEPREWPGMFLGSQSIALVLPEALVESGEVEAAVVTVFDWPAVETVTGEAGEIEEIAIGEESWTELSEIVISETYSSELSEWWAEDEMEMDWIDKEVDFSDGGGEDGPVEPELGGPGGLALRPKTEAKQVSRMEEVIEKEIEVSERADSFKREEVGKEVRETEEVMMINKKKQREKKQEDGLKEEVSYELEQEVTEEQMVRKKVVYQIEEEEQEAVEMRVEVDDKVSEEGEKIPEWEIDLVAVKEEDVPMVVFEDLELSVPVKSGLEVFGDASELAEGFLRDNNMEMLEWMNDYASVVVALLYAMLGNKLVRLRVPVEMVGGVVRQQRVI